MNSNARIETSAIPKCLVALTECVSTTSATATTALEGRVVKCQTKTNVNIDPVMSLHIVRTQWAASIVPVFLATKATDSNVTILTNAKFHHWPLFASKMPNAVIYQDIMFVSVAQVTQETPQSLARTSTSA